jgi:hypothetical protein
MNKNMFKLKLMTIILFLMASTFVLKAQLIGVGAEGIYNIQTESIGTGIRASFFPNKRFSFTPQFSYFFPFNKINEFTIGLGIEGKFIKRKKINVYGKLHGGYNSWINYKTSLLKDAKPNNWNFEGGLGISTNTCLRPFIEYRYNVKFKETHLNLGFLYIFGCSKKNKYNNNERCPSFK